ncbi:MAG: N-acetylmuramoyl-L-alanine amidase [Gammaproteobacteria bacterium]
MRLFSAICCLLCCRYTWAVDIQAVRVLPSLESTRVALDLSAGVEYQVFTLSGPERVVVDLQDTRLRASLPRSGLGDAVTQVRAGIQKGVDLRVVLDVVRRFNVKSALLPADRQRGPRLQLELFPQGYTPGDRVSPPARWRDIVIAIDAGHGGQDPGAIGPTGVQEKQVTLAIAKRLARLVNQERGLMAVLIRDSDRYIGLRQRFQKAREHKADLFVSIHADAFRDPRIRGSSVYVLSEKGASNEAARWLAEQENAADFIGEVSLHDKDEVLKSVLLDLSQTAAMDASMAAAHNILASLQRIGPVHRRYVQYASFAVLKSPDIPSVLVETAFITNPREEQRLSYSSHRQHLAQAMAYGIQNYFSEHPPPDTLMAMGN